jgi:Leucine-rich repeat (LRR) protein
MFLRVAVLCVSIAFAGFAADREVAEWALREGGSVTLEGSSTPVSDITELPAGAIHIAVLDLTNTNFDPRELERVGTLTGLRELYLNGPAFNPAFNARQDGSDLLKYLANLKNLERLYFSLHFTPTVNISDAGIGHLAGLTKLKEIRLTQCKVSKPDLAPFVNLESLDLNYTSFNDQGMKNLEGVKKLKRLLVHDTLVTDAGLKSLAA